MFNIKICAKLPLLMAALMAAGINTAFVEHTWAQGELGRRGSLEKCTANDQIVLNLKSKIVRLSLDWEYCFSAKSFSEFKSDWSFEKYKNRTGWNNKERQYYGDESDNVIELGREGLVVKARPEDLHLKNDWGGQTYVSARISSEKIFARKYGLFEAEAKMPCTMGLWPAVWLLPPTGTLWPTSGEIDIVEFTRSKWPYVSQALHTTTTVKLREAGRWAGADHSHALLTACGQFHRYQVYWTPLALYFMIDGSLYREITNERIPILEELNAPLHFIINVAVGGDYTDQVIESSSAWDGLSVRSIRYYN